MGFRADQEVSEKRKVPEVRIQHRAVRSIVAIPTTLTPASCFEYNLNTCINLYSSTSFPIFKDRGKGRPRQPHRLSAVFILVTTTNGTICGTQITQNLETAHCGLHCHPPPPLQNGQHFQSCSLYRHTKHNLRKLTSLLKQHVKLIKF